MKKILLTILIFLSFSLISFAQEEKEKIYVRKGCAHCLKVEAFVEKYELKDRVEVIETYNDEEKTNELNSHFSRLNISNAGVPFMLIGENEYYMGDTPIIKYLAQKYEITIEESEYQTSTSDVVFLSLGGLFLFSVLGYGLYSMLKKK